MHVDFRYCPVCATELVMRADSAAGADGDKARLACPDGHWTHWDNPVPVLAALVELEGRILLARNAAWGPKNFALITGFMERGETPEQGIQRAARRNRTHGGTNQPDWRVRIHPQE
jgi:NADH pyrophosphatase NudC (nudix superfamily)